MKKLISLESLSRNELAAINGGGTNKKNRACARVVCTSDFSCVFPGSPSSSCRCPFQPSPGSLFRQCFGF
ncbi:hypothetical protein KTO58_20040 [Chitinophaga pendula]|uniref:hypothetical protein n=1 Tax=Chitinophaga TaxID=79328 RepID=UPI0012FE41B6|nr:MULTISPECIES: hypothetical protein [Chitinophaga]UCJ05959.1 hypothetical protein KTO58_20040 [Chitinophaga pendula]